MGLFRIRTIIIVNPGEATDWITGSARVAIVELEDMSYTTEPLGWDETQ